ncbi:hypothetical protein K8Z61_12725 [Nocardioides sp. TRM66260-LWL]|uniref:hypothetical protein n=1 Tax=Nocardioides sp. TRM66260-LWL TaxID=2874478 RepID=UPI001CC341D4|nr:hypothetical protein [Nocardioides sp. TRM66260-LWL]MBZ5735361.1 hypothetical protein [Nocardioides sp. TRM66260-LWL]
MSASTLTIQTTAPTAEPTAPATPATRVQRERRRGQGALATAVAASLDRSGKWEQWQQVELRLAGFADLQEACAGWRRRDDECYEMLAGLVALGSRRGGDDDDAALAVLVVLADGVNRVAGQLSDLQCEVGDVHAMVWEEVKAAEPQLGNRAGRYLLDRARQRLCRPAAGLLCRVETTSLDAWLVGEAGSEVLGTGLERGVDDCDLTVAVPVVEDAVEDLVDLLVWAREVGVIAPGEIDLLVELMAAEHELLARGETKRAREEAQRIVGERHGVTLRQIRRRRDQTTARLRDAAPQYLEAIA